MQRGTPKIIEWEDAVAMLGKRVRVYAEATERCHVYGIAVWLPEPFHGIGIIDPAGRGHYHLIGRQRSTIRLLEKREKDVAGPKQLRGFALLSKERRQEVGSRGGKTAHARGTARHWTSETAKIASARSRRGKRDAQGSAPEEAV